MNVMQPTETFCEIFAMWSVQNNVRPNDLLYQKGVLFTMKHTVGAAHRFKKNIHSETQFCLSLFLVSYQHDLEVRGFCRFKEV